MSTLANNPIFDGSTDANFRSWTQAINAHMTTGGFWTATTDTGQVDLTTVTHPAQSDTVFAGYKIFKTNDALSSTFTLYMRVDYGTANRFGGSFTPLVVFSFGTGTDGAGTLTGNLSGQYKHFPDGNIATASASSAHSSGGTGYWGMFGWDGVVDTKGAFQISIERAKDSSGNYTADYLTWVICLRTGSTGANLMSQRSVRKPALGTFSTELGNAFSLFLNLTTAAFGTFASPFPVFPFFGFPDNPMTAVMGMKSGDIADLGTLDVTVYGVSHHYLWSNRGAINFGTATGMTSTGVGIRYE